MNVMIRVLLVKVGQDPVVVETSNDLEALQALVGGLLECVPMQAGYDLWLNESARMLGLPRNRIVVDIARGRPVGYAIHGDFFLAKHDGDGDIVSMPAEVQVGLSDGELVLLNDNTLSEGKN